MHHHLKHFLSIQFVADSRLAQKCATTKMELLKLNRKILKTLGLCALAEESDFYSQFGQWTIACLHIFCLTLAFTASVLYFGVHYRDDGVQRCILAVAQIFGIIPTAVSFVYLIFQAEKIRNFYDHIQSMFDQCE